MNNKDKDMLILGFFALVVAIAFAFIPNSHPPKTQTYYESHTVKPGETLSQIVDRYHGSLKSTLAEHPSSVVMPGEVVEVVIQQ